MEIPVRGQRDLRRDAKLFSIIITSHNQCEFIRDAVNSALSARHVDKEIIVVDDASTDGTQEILSQYSQAIRFLPFDVNRGACAARNAGVAEASGEYLVFLDGDDAFLPWALDVYERIIQAKRPKIIVGSMQWFKGALPGIRPEDNPHAMEIVDYEDYMRKDRPVGNSASALVIDRRTFQEVKGWPEDLFPADDFDLTIRLGESGRTIYVLSPPTTLHRAHASNTVNSVPRCLSAVSQLIERERFGRYPGGKRLCFERYGLIGGSVFFWSKRAVKRGYYSQAAKLMARGWPMVLVAAARRLGVMLTGRQPSETITI